MTNVTILVTHLLGTGHMSRALALATACKAGGLETLLISGGMPVPHLDTSGVDFLQLPPVRSDGVGFSRLLDRAGDPATEGLLAGRIDTILDTFRTRPTDVLITELFPFGRRSLATEFETVLRTAKAMAPAPVVLSSIRDILEPQAKPIKAIETRERLLQFYDGVLVHSDPSFVHLEESWPIADDIAQMLHYTGYITRPIASTFDERHDGADEILVTAGGGPVGRQLFEIAIEAARKSGSRRWRMLVGGFDAAEVCEQLNAKAVGAPAIAETTRVDYREMLTRCAAAVGQCGYNTAIDWLQAGVPGVFVPFADAGEVEQTRRAALFHQHYGYSVIAEDELAPDNLIAAVDGAIGRGRVVIDDADLDGGRGTVRIIQDMLRQRC